MFILIVNAIIFCNCLTFLLSNFNLPVFHNSNAFVLYEVLQEQRNNISLFAY